MISKGISDDIPPQKKILNMVIPILMHFCSFTQIGALQTLNGARHTMKRDVQVINDIKLFPIVYRRIYCRNFFMLSNQTLCYNSF